MDEEKQNTGFDLSKLTDGQYLNDMLINQVGPFLLKAGGAILLIWIGFLIIDRVQKVLRSTLKKAHVDESLRRFLLSLGANIAKFFLVTTVALPLVLGDVGALFTTVIGAATLALGFALQGSLSNFAGGVMILMFKPYKIGHYIKVGETLGTVQEIQMFSTVLKTVDNKRVIIPNGELSNGIITNYSVEGERRLEIPFGIGYSDDIDKARKIIEEVASKNPKVLTEPAHDVEVIGLGESSVDLEYQGWVKSKDYLSVKYYMLEEVKKAFDKEGVSIPFPQRDVNVYNKNL